MAKLNTKLFNMLRDRAWEKYPCALSPTVEEKFAEKKNAIKKAVDSASVEQLKDCIIGLRCPVQYFNIQIPYVHPVDKNEAARNAFLNKVDEAELRHMAGDDAAATALIAEVL